jgi:hypothetical protein
VETYGRLGNHTVEFMGMLGAEAMAAGNVSKSGFVATALWKLSVGLCKGNYLLHQTSLGVLAGASAWEWIGLLRMCVNSDVRAALCFPCLLDFAPLSSTCHDVEHLDLDDVVFLHLSRCKLSAIILIKSTLHCYYAIPAREENCLMHSNMISEWFLICASTFSRRMCK